MNNPFNRPIYFDNNATTACAPEVFDALKPFACERYGNPSSIHSFGGSVMHEIEKARWQLANLIGCDNKDPKGNCTEIVFTSCGTESNSTAIRSALDLNPARRKLIISTVEHPAVRSLAHDLAKRDYQIVEIPVDAKGRLDMDLLRDAIDHETALVSIMWANNETGNIYPVEEIAEMSHKFGALFHTDAVQAVGKIPMDMKNSKIDMLSLSGHKLHAPKGVGALFIRRGVHFRPFLIGGHQERNRRGGTENILGIIGLGKAAELAAANLVFENTKVKELRDYLETEMFKRIPTLRVNGDQEHRLPNTALISYEFIEGESILMLLDQYGICASSGSACTTGSLEPSHVLRAMGVPYTAAHGAVRFSLSRYNTREEVDFLLEVMPPIIAKLRSYSPYWNEK
ncbi:MAG: cysteine desulfurase NifS [Victivallaceae bacterium]|nr:cysteine desulfurase NifS [Victivallaceae bacterium]